MIMFCIVFIYTCHELHNPLFLCLYIPLSLRKLLDLHRAQTLHNEAHCIPVLVLVLLQTPDNLWLPGGSLRNGICLKQYY